jgi:hypothetical protein
VFDFGQLSDFRRQIMGRCGRAFASSPYARRSLFAASRRLIYLIARIANNRQIMGEFKSGIISNIFVWLTFIFMGATAVAMFATL